MSIGSIANIPVSIPSILYLILLLSSCQAEEQVQIIKCCPEGSILNKNFDCVKSTTNLLTSLKKYKSNQNREIYILDHKKPTCQRLEHQRLERNLITSSGGVYSSKYNEDLKPGDVCFDLLENDNSDQDAVFLNCNPCGDKICVNLCCHHSHAYKDALEKEEKDHRCDPEPAAQKKCQFHEGGELTSLKEQWMKGASKNVEKEKEILLVSTQSLFSCPGKESLVPVELLYGPQEMQLQTDGRLHVIFEDIENNTTEVNKFASSEFCLALSDIAEYDEYYPEYDTSQTIEETSTTAEVAKIRAIYSVCYEVEAEKGETFTSIFYPTAIFISCFFIFLTIVIYGIIPDLRSNLFGKITLGFLCNVLICYFFLGVHYCLDLKENRDFINTPFCKFLGYITQHTFIAFFFWMNAMAINITKKFSNILVASREGKQRKALALNILYAQGVPLLISLVTALLDTYGSCDSILPNMGKYNCFVGAEFNPNTLFIFTPEFVYFYLIISIIVVINLICFIITAYFLTAHWSTVRTMTTSSGDNLWVHIMVVLKIFLIMGIPWILDVISAAIAHKVGVGKSFEARLTLDILNLLTGMLTFVVLICKKTVLKKLNTKFSSGQNQHSSSSMKTQESLNLRKFSTVSGISTFSTLSADSSEL